MSLGLSVSLRVLVETKLACWTSDCSGEVVDGDETRDGGGGGAFRAVHYGGNVHASQLLDVPKHSLQCSR